MGDGKGGRLARVVPVAAQDIRGLGHSLAVAGRARGEDWRNGCGGSFLSEHALLLGADGGVPVGMGREPGLPGEPHCQRKAVMRIGADRLVVAGDAQDADGAYPVGKDHGRCADDIDLRVAVEEGDFAGEAVSIKTSSASRREM